MDASEAYLEVRSENFVSCHKREFLRCKDFNVLIFIFIGTSKVLNLVGNNILQKTWKSNFWSVTFEYFGISGCSSKVRHRELRCNKIRECRWDFRTLVQAHNNIRKNQHIPFYFFSKEKSNYGEIGQWSNFCIRQVTQVTSKRSSSTTRRPEYITHGSSPEKTKESWVI